jgi:5'(3')-deoxyribonucleotidase
MMKPRIGVDLDGCVVALTRYVLARVNIGLGTRYVDEDWTSYRAKDCFLEHGKVFTSIIYDPETYRHLEPIDGALDTLHRLSKKADIIIVTSRPVDCATATHEWMAHHRVPSIGLIMTDDKVRYARALGMKAFVDDRMKTIESMVGVVSLPILMNQAWNQGDVEGVMRARSWEEVEDWLLEAV